MKTFDSLESATEYANNHPNYGKQFTSPNQGDTSKWCVWENQSEYDLHNKQSVVELPETITPEQLRACFPNEEFQNLIVSISGDAVATAFLFDALMRTDNGINRRDSRFIDGVQYFLEKEYLSSENATKLLR